MTEELGRVVEQPYSYGTNRQSLKVLALCRSKLGEKELKRMQNQTKLQSRENYCGGHETVTWCNVIVCSQNQVRMVGS